METTILTTSSRTAPDGQVLADPAWLAARLGDPDLRVVEVDVSPKSYDGWHIDGAVLWDVYQDLLDPDYRLADTGALEALLVRSGITSRTTVVFYGYAPAFAFWLMKLFGHDDARILNCSRDAWQGAGHPCAETSPRCPRGSYHLGHGNPSLRATVTEVHAAIADPATMLVDVRSDAEYRGERFWPSGGMEPGGRAGHIPSAVHQPVDGLYNPDGSFHPPAELRERLSMLDIEGSDELITYCTIGGRAATAWFVLTHLLGRDNVRVYDGSWAEWGRLPDAPVETV